MLASGLVMMATDTARGPAMLPLWLALILAVVSLGIRDD
jgi:hypothetical protein